MGHVLAAASHTRTLHCSVHLLAGAGLALAALAIRALPDLALTFSGWSRWLFAAGAVVALLGLVTYRPALARIAMVACLLLSATLVGLGFVEFLFRALHHDFDRTEAKLQRLPPFFRKPLVPTGTVFYRRAGPDHWTGRPLYSLLEQQGVRPNPYTNEAVITVAYDAGGFRNEPALRDWEIAVAGDSFTELGHLPFEQLYTTQLGQRLGCRVRNLGVSHTGPFTHLHYLEAFGLAPSTREVLIMFYEGNDLGDLDYEAAALREFTQTGRRPKRGRRPQTSFLRAVHDTLVRQPLEPQTFEATANAWFAGVAGRQSLTVGRLPSMADELQPRTREALDAFLRQHADFARRHRVMARLAYLPTKETVLFDQLSVGAEALEGWERPQRTDLPAHYFAGRCAELGIPFLDLTPALIAETQRRRELLFNGMYDTHLNARGAEIIARELAGWLGAGNRAVTIR